MHNRPALRSGDAVYSETAHAKLAMPDTFTNYNSFSIIVTKANSAVSAATRGPCDPNAYSSRPSCSQLSRTVTVTVTRSGVTVCSAAGVVASLSACLTLASSSRHRAYWCVAQTMLQQQTRKRQYYESTHCSSDAIQGMSAAHSVASVLAIRHQSCTPAYMPNIT
eukprot:6224-Heterococcus_DN1.PRE.2